MRPWHLYGVLGLVIAGLWWGMQPEEPPVSRIVVLNRPTVLPSTSLLPPVPAVSASVSLNTTDTVSATACKAFKVNASHTAEAQADAQDGAIDDLGDICPSQRVTQVQQHCEPLSPEPGVFLQRCRAEGLCQLCGEHFARYREIQTERP